MDFEGHKPCVCVCVCSDQIWSECERSDKLFVVPYDPNIIERLDLCL